jgi:hypothetical protein
VESVSKLAEVRANGNVKLCLELTMGRSGVPAVVNDVRAIFETHPGSAPVEIDWSDGNGLRERFRSRSLTVAVNPGALAELRSILGDSAVRLQRV